MPQIKSVNIPKPCHEAWQAMTPVSGGRHCQSCCKTVTDFTAMSNDEIIAYLSSNYNVCGRFNAGQITNVNYGLQADHTPAIPKLKGWTLILAMLGSIPFYKAIAQTKPSTVQTNCSSVPKPETPVIIGKVVSQYKIITGIVTDEQNLPITGVIINVPGNSRLCAATNSSGKFSLRVPAAVTEIDIHYVGFITRKVSIDAIASQQNYTIQLKEVASTMGEVVVVKRPPFIKRVYFHYVRRPYRALKKKLASF